MAFAFRTAHALVRTLKYGVLLFMMELGVGNSCQGKSTNTTLWSEHITLTRTGPWAQDDLRILLSYSEGRIQAQLSDSMIQNEVDRSVKVCCLCELKIAVSGWTWNDMEHVDMRRPRSTLYDKVRPKIAAEIHVSKIEFTWECTRPDFYARGR
jgi:hypothetical protein